MGLVVVTTGESLPVAGTGATFSVAGALVGPTVGLDETAGSEVGPATGPDGFGAALAGSMSVSTGCLLVISAAGWGFTGFDVTREESRVR